MPYLRHVGSTAVSMPRARYSAVAGMCARSASTTGLRPTRSSGASLGGADLRPGATRGSGAADRSCDDAAARRSFSCFQAVRLGTSSPEYALCHGRSSAGRVRPFFAASPSRFLPPEPIVGPFLGVVRRPRRCELPGISRPPRT